MTSPTLASRPLIDRYCAISILAERRTIDAKARDVRTPDSARPTPRGKKRNTLRSASTPPKEPQMMQNGEFSGWPDWGINVAAGITHRLATTMKTPTRRSCCVAATVVGIGDLSGCKFGIERKSFPHVA